MVQMAIALLLTIYCICVVVASLAGGALPALMTLTHRQMQMVMSFVGGLMLGVALLHLDAAFTGRAGLDRSAGRLDARRPGDNVSCSSVYFTSMPTSMVTQRCCRRTRSRPEAHCEHHHELMIMRRAASIRSVGLAWRWDSRCIP